MANHTPAAKGTALVVPPVGSIIAWHKNIGVLPEPLPDPLPDPPPEPLPDPLPEPLPEPRITLHG